MRWSNWSTDPSKTFSFNFLGPNSSLKESLIDSWLRRTGSVLEEPWMDKPQSTLKPKKLWGSIHSMEPGRCHALPVDSELQ